jgi:hypothetical protein
LITHKQEADKIYQAIFHCPAPAALLERYVPAAQRLEQQASPDELAAQQQAVETTRDLEALEYASRFARRMPLLNYKFRLVVYLAETLPENQAFFIKDKPGLLPALFELAWAGVKSAFKLAKGYLLFSRVSRG